MPGSAAGRCSRRIEAGRSAAFPTLRRPVGTAGSDAMNTRKPNTRRGAASGLLALGLICLAASPALAGAKTAQPGPHAAKHGQHRHPGPKKRHLQRQRPIYWGAWIGDQLTGTPAPWDMGAVAQLEQRLGKGLSLIQFATPFADCSSSPCSFYRFPASPMDSIRGYGAIPFLSWSSASTPAATILPDFQLSDVISGAYDSYIRAFAAEAAAWGHPFFLRYDWEMNGDWFPWSEGVNGNKPGEFVAAWHHVHDMFREAGANNATWVWCPYADSSHRYKSLKRYWPGTAYVDWTCLDGYNFSKTPVNPHPWMSFDQIFAPSYRTVVKRIAPKKPMLIGETASNGIGRGKAIWISRMFSKLRSHYRRVRGLIWFDQLDRGIRWPLETSTAVTRSFGRGVGQRAFRANHYGTIADSPISPPK